MRCCKLHLEIVNVNVDFGGTGKKGELDLEILLFLDQV